MCGCGSVYLFLYVVGGDFSADGSVRHWSEYSRISLGSCFIVTFFFFKTNGIWFYPRSLGYLIPWPPKQYWVCVHLAEWILSPSRHWLIIFTRFVPSLTKHNFTGRKLLQIKGFMAGLMFIFLLVACRMSSQTKTLEHRGKGSV